MSTAGFWIGNAHLVGYRDKSFTHRTWLVGLKSWKVLWALQNSNVKPMYKTEIPEHLLKFSLGIQSSVMKYMYNFLNIFSYFDFSVHPMVLLLLEHWIQFWLWCGDFCSLSFAHILGWGFFAPPHRPWSFRSPICCLSLAMTCCLAMALLGLFFRRIWDSGLGLTRFQDWNPVNKNAELPSVSPDHTKSHCPEGLWMSGASWDDVNGIWPWRWHGVGWQTRLLPLGSSFPPDVWAVLNQSFVSWYIVNQWSQPTLSLFVHQGL